MPRKTSLTVVKAGVQQSSGGDRKAPPVKKPTTLKGAADSSERELLVMLRDKISDQIEVGVPPHTLAPLMRQMRDIDKEIRALDARREQEIRSSDGRTIDDRFDASAI